MYEQIFGNLTTTHQERMTACCRAARFHFSYTWIWPEFVVVLSLSVLLKKLCDKNAWFSDLPKASSASLMSAWMASMRDSAKTEHESVILLK